MVPLGALLIAEDVPLVRRPTVHAMNAIEGWWKRRRRSAQ
jgi:hypothetical protein